MPKSTSWTEAIPKIKPITSSDAYLNQSINQPVHQPAETKLNQNLQQFFEGILKASVVKLSFT